MRFQKVLICLVVAITSLPATSAIYKTLDADGNTVFSDTPPDKNAEKVELEPINIQPAFVPPAPLTPKDVPPDNPAYTLAFSYPQHDQTIRSNAGNITIALSVTPAPDSNSHKILVVKMDGKEIFRGINTRISLDAVPRGTHTLDAHLENADGKQLAKANSIKFHLLRVSLPVFRADQ